MLLLIIFKITKYCSDLRNFRFNLYPLQNIGINFNYLSLQGLHNQMLGLFAN